MALTRFRFECDGVTIEGEGVVTVTGADATEADLGPAVAAFLSALDPELIERAALDRQGFGSGSLVAEIFGVLRDIAEGKAP